MRDDLKGYNGPRVIINPAVKHDDRDAMCVAWNESFRILMEVNGFDPVSEPTERQRKFFSDTAYNDDELMLRRTILARICTFDTSVKDPTDEQLQEAVEFLDTVMEIGAPQNEWEQQAVKRIRDTIERTVGQPRAEEPSGEEPPEDAGAITGAVGGGETDEADEFLKNAQELVDEARKLAAEGPDAEDTKRLAMARAAGAAGGDDPFGKSTEMNAAARAAGVEADVAEAKKPENLMQKNGHFVDDQGRIITRRAAEALAEQHVRRAGAPRNDAEPVADRDNASARIGMSSGMTGIGGRQLMAGEAAWEEKRKKQTDLWRQRTGG